MSGPRLLGRAGLIAVGSLVSTSPIGGHAQTAGEPRGGGSEKTPLVTFGRCVRRHGRGAPPVGSNDI
jgi:hypothetical protein